MASFGVPSSPTKSIITIDNFRGVDFLNTPANVDLSRSTDAKNFIRGDRVGSVRKRKGYECIHDFGGDRINGVYRFCGNTYYHVGTQLYDSYYNVIDGIELADKRSSSANISDKLVIIDGEHFIYAYRGEDGNVVFCNAVEDAYVPTVVIGRVYGTNGFSGSLYEPVNLLTPKVTESFYVRSGQETIEGNTKILEFPFSFVADINSVATVSHRSAGEWIALDRNEIIIIAKSDTSIRFGIGVVKFPTYDDDGITDNWRVTYTRQNPSDLGLVLRNHIITSYGVSGAPDRLFVAGDPEHPNIDRYSEFNNPLYFPDTSYCEVGGNESPITAYSVVGTHLAIHKNKSPDGRNIYLREGSFDSEGEVVFKTVNSLHGYGAITSHGNAFLESENLFLTDNGIYAVTSVEMTQERYSQSRSLFVDKLLTLEKDLSQAYAHSFGGFYYLCVNNHVYALDSLQRSYFEYAPYSKFQYECYYLDNIPARVMYDDGEYLYFGSSDGKIYRVYSDETDPTHYNDDGKAIEAYWTTPEITGKQFFKSKTFRYVSVKLAAASRTGATIYAMIRGKWDEIFDSKGKAGFWDWSYINFAKISFSSDQSSRTLGGKIKIKKVDKVSLKIANNEYNESCGLYSLGVVYVQNNYFKK